ncbi:MAG TPA: signal peptidase I [Gemmatimonadales bacterium]|jgi:signal peptidase I
MPKPTPAAPPSPSLMHTIKDWTKSLAVGFAMFLVLRAFLIEAFHIPSESMENTLLIGDVLFVNKAIYGAGIPFTSKHLPAFRSPKRQDVVIFSSPETPDTTVVKRVIGVPGDTISMENDSIYVNGKALAEPYVKREVGSVDIEDPKMAAWQRSRVVKRDPQMYRPSLKNWGPMVVPRDSFFVMGDNREESYDSRYWGFLGRDRIEGSPLFIYYSWDKDGPLPLAPITGIRWSRLLHVVR